MTDAVTVRKDGKAEMAFRQGLKPWHGLGDDIPAGASIDEWKKRAGMDWDVRRARVQYEQRVGEHFPPTVRAWPEQHVLYRSDTGEPLGVVSDRFNIVQPMEVLEFYRDLQESGFTIETAGTLFGGRRFWALASIGEYDRILSDADVMKGYLLLATACDGSMKTEARETSVCVVCNNTLEAARAEGGKRVVSVSHRSQFDADAVKDQLNIARGNFGAFVKDMRKLAKEKIDGETFDSLTLDLLRDRKADSLVEEAKKVRESRPYQAILQLFDGRGMGADLDGRKGTAWGWLNAVTEYVDHHARARSDNNRLNSAWFGKGEQVKNDAARLALELV